MSHAFKSSFSNREIRISRLMTIVFLAAAAITIRVFFLQVIKHNVYYAIAQDQYQFLKKLVPNRGKIYVNDFVSSKTYPVAVNEETQLIYAVPNEVKDAADAGAKLAPLLGISQDELAKKIGKKNDSYEPLKHGVSRESGDEINKLNIAGIRTSPESTRYYPDGVFASNVLGFVGYGDDGKRSGRYGVESFYNQELEGKSGYLETELDARGNWIPTALRDTNPAKDGSDIVLTMDQTIQFMAEKKLKEAVESLKAEGGTIIVMDPRKGSILAMANFPNFDPNEYWKVEKYEDFLNPAIQKRYEPGSVMKPFTMAAALDTGKITPNTTYDDKGYVTVNDVTIHNFDNKGRGLTTMTEVLQQSLNTGAVYAETLAGKSALYSYFKDFGFDLPTGIDLDGELAGDLASLDNTKSDVAYATASFGQGVSITPLELIAGVSAIANDGKLMKPYIVDKIVDSDGRETASVPKMVRQVITPKTAAQLSAMMVSVIDSSFYKRAYIPGYNLAGKSGTAQIANSNKKGYSDQTIHTLVGFGPVPSPQFAILIKVDKPQDIKFASTSITPAFHDMSKFLLDYYHVEPNINQ